MSIKTPELDKMEKVREESQKIGEFMDWLRGEKGLEIATWIDDEDRGRESLVPANVHTEKFLAEYFNIDLDKAEQERRALIESIRSDK